MEKLFLLMVMFATCCAAPRDMSGKVFTFPRESKIDLVKLLTHKQSFNALTTCLRYQTDLSRNHVLMSLATPTKFNAFVLFKPELDNTMRMHALDGVADFKSLAIAPNTWHSMCATWSSATGLAQLWLDGKATIKKFIKTGALTGQPISVLGQEQDTYGGGYDINQSFIGMITEVHMWDTVIPSTEIKRYMAEQYVTPGNVFNWRALEFEITGQVLVEDMRDVK
ncbi:C-reactive protein-like [Cottoperca gobio]|uniref:Pentraxin family member n=1 Tax=Cottoperca gobio TaxID=56716 RepID=A0A6J2RC41_COTGO|nr:C-reactive protein-like [Cottoperca gobio]